LNDIIITTIPHCRQRYDTAGDYRETGGALWSLTVSEMPDPRMEAALIVHELVEMILTKHRGITWGEIDRFDMGHPELDDPGADPRAPYHLEHLAAEQIEKQMCILLGLPWAEYQAAFDALKFTNKE